MTAYLAVGAGGALGAMLRLWVARLLTAPTGALPIGTLVINIVGSFLLGVLIRAWPTAEPQPALRLLLTVGVCGGFTTFSTFSAELFVMLGRGAWVSALTYVLSSLVGGVLAIAAGVALAARLGAPVP
ncbi:MAG: fluoride efflux transporter CrcB [Gemmatimonadaceae bacterium]|jgi:CrcB protein|nr:fluoride efflux transporter CrcB [Gemmatimonadaceae bacterium]